jgi:hypothetical protein
MDLRTTDHIPLLRPSRADKTADNHRGATAFILASVARSALPLVISPLLSYSYFPVAAYAVRSLEAELARTQQASRTISRMLDCVNTGKPLDKDDILLISTDERWNEVPWSRIIAVVREMQTEKPGSAPEISQL